MFIIIHFASITRVKITLYTIPFASILRVNIKSITRANVTLYMISFTIQYHMRSCWLLFTLHLLQEQTLRYIWLASLSNIICDHVYYYSFCIFYTNNFYIYYKSNHYAEYDLLFYSISNAIIFIIISICIHYNSIIYYPISLFTIQYHTSNSHYAVYD